MKEEFRVSSFRTKIYLGGCREIVASINHSSPNLVQQTIFRYFLRRATLRPVSNQFVIVSGESVGKFIAGTRLTANIRACVSVASSQSTAGLGEL